MSGVELMRVGGIIFGYLMLFVGGLFLASWTLDKKPKQLWIGTLCVLMGFTVNIYAFVRWIGK